MQSIIDYFSTIPSLHRTIILVGGLTFFWILESAIPLFRFEYKKWSHARVNIFFTMTTILVNFSLAFLLVMISDHVAGQKWGLLHLVAMPGWLFCISGLLMLDLVGAYTIHYLEHKVKWMWQFHLVHHTDQHIDTTTANRHHPGESFLRFIFTILAVLISGAPMWLVMMYQTLSVVLTQFNHSNIRMNKTLDKVLGLVVCTPNIHRVHHHFRQPLTDSNYGNIFSFWDRIFGTFATSDNEVLKYGLDTYPDPREVSRIDAILKMPFQKYRTPLIYEDKNAPMGS